MRALQPAANQGNVIVKRPSPAPSAVSTTSDSTADYTFFEPVKAKVVLPPARPATIRPAQGYPAALVPPQENLAPRQSSSYVLQGLDSGLRPLGGPAAEFARQRPPAQMGENDMLAHIRPAKGFDSPARPSTFGNASPYNVGNGVRPGAMAGVASRPMYDAQGRPIQPRALAATLGPNGYPLPLPSASSTNPHGDDDGEDFSAGLKAVPATAEDYARSADPEADMLELLSGAIGTGEEPARAGDEIVDGFASGIKLMPHQIRGTAWIAQRETGRKYGGILADVGGLHGGPGRV